MFAVGRFLAGAALLCALAPSVSAQARSSLRWSELRVDPPGRFDAAQAARLDETMRQAGGQEVPVKRWRGWYFPQVRMNGREVVAFLDTGAPRNALGSAAAMDAGLVGDEEEGGYLQSKVQMGGRELGPFTVRVEPRAARTRRPGLLGLPTLQAFGAVIDTARGKLWIARREPTALSQALARARSDAIPLLRSPSQRDRLYVSATINGVRGFLLVDTGVANTTLSQSAGQRTKIAWVSQPDKVSVDYRGREHHVYTGRPASFTLGGVSVPPVMLMRRDQPLLEYVADDAPDAWGPFLGLLGTDALASLEAVVDCGGGRIYLRHQRQK